MTGQDALRANLQGSNQGILCGRRESSGEDAAAIRAGE
jgi:hypothetical protein